MRARGSVLVVVVGVLAALATLVLGISSSSFRDNQACDYALRRARAELLARSGLERAIAAIVSGEDLSIFTVPPGTGEDISHSLGPNALFDFETKCSARAFSTGKGRYYAVRLFDCSSRPPILADREYLRELARFLRLSGGYVGSLGKCASRRLPGYDLVLSSVPGRAAGLLDPLGRAKNVNVNTAPQVVLNWALSFIDEAERPFLVEGILRARPFRDRRDWNSVLVALSVTGRGGRTLSERVLNDVLNATDDRSEAPPAEWGDGEGGFSRAPGVYGLSVARARAAAEEAGAELDARALAPENGRRRFEGSAWWKKAVGLLGHEGGERKDELATEDDPVPTVRFVFRSRHYLITSLGAVFFDAPGPEGMRQAKLGVRLQAVFDAREGRLLSLRWLD